MLNWIFDMNFVILLISVFILFLVSGINIITSLFSFFLSIVFAYFTFFESSFLMHTEYSSYLYGKYTSKYETKVLYNEEYFRDYKTLGFLICNKSTYGSNICKDYLAYFEKNNIVDVAKELEADALEKQENKKTKREKSEEFARNIKENLKEIADKALESASN